MKDLTKGSPTKLLLGFAIPLLIGNIFQLFYNLVDSRVVGQFLGDDAYAALGATTAINSLVIGFLIGLTNGFSIIVARNFGANDKNAIKRSVATSLILGLITAVLLTALSVVFLMPLLRMLNTPEEIINESAAYIRVILLGMTATMLYNLCSGILRAMGDTVTPLIFLIIAAVINVILDLVFIPGLKMGVEGAAYATLISQIFSFIACLIYMLKKYPILRLSKEDFKMSSFTIKELYSTGISMGFMLSLVAIGTVALQSSINSFDIKTISAHTAARKISETFMLPISVFGAAAATFSSQNLGARQIDRIKAGIKRAILLIWIWSAVVIILCYLFTPFFVKLLTGTSNQDIINTAYAYMKFNAPFYFILCILIVLRNAMQGIGDRVSPIFSSIIELIGKVAVVIFLAPKLGYFGIIISEPITWVLCTILLSVNFLRNPIFRKLKSNLKEDH